MRPSVAFFLAGASLWHRRRVLALVTLTLTLSVTLLLGVQYLRTEVRQTFNSTVSGTDLIIGARSGELNLLLYSIFHIGNATNNIRWSTFQKLEEDSRIDWLVPLSLGDSYRGYRVVGTDERFLNHYQYGDDRDLALDRGRWFDDVFEVVLGAEVARAMDHAIADEVVLSHGGGRTSFLDHDRHPFTVSGILAPTGTPVDRGVYVSLQGLEAIHVGWESGVPSPGRTLPAGKAREVELTPTHITAALAGIERQILTFQVQRHINQMDTEPLSAILPGVALSQLWQVLGQFESVLLGITVFVVLTSLAGLITVLLTLQSHRHQEIAVLRANGATPLLIAALYLMECSGLALLSAVLATLLWYAGLGMLAPWLLSEWGLAISLRPPTGIEWLMLASVPIAGLLVGMLPAVRAWRLGNRPSGWGAARDMTG
ncbi:putative ABC transport system permease protein [Marinobacter daqiaonensis]|uniref:Putative ABC transport system permease protein n=1 Tax=Marinobacter daqiaonensis TaxID=650891 RepID=A0A1I6I128_9GAMM|nr:ABC transporter permease [Marinobacter daqiaonensis]SFR60349.1 putative ABC transport system permease protein [Marinobacter daqiaonensis]